MERKRGITLIETLISVAIIIILAGSVAVVATSVKRSARQTKSISDMRQIFLAVEMYKADYDIKGPTPGDGLPVASGGTSVPWYRTFGTPSDLWIGCGDHPFAPASHSVTYFFVPIGAPYAQWSQQWNDGLPLVFDLSCSPSSVHLDNNFERRFGLAVTVSGSAIRKWNTGSPFDPSFWSEPPGGI
jgi:type II secretory pathway pseudopilin PulG